MICNPGMIWTTEGNFQTPRLSLLQTLFGRDYVETVYLVGFNYTQVTDEGLVHLKRLTNLESLSLTSTQITDVGLEHLKTLDSLQELNLYDTQVTPEGVRKLQEALPNCEIEY